MRLGGAGLLSLCAMTFSASLAAQEPEGSASDGRIPEVTVTATKRETTVQDTPLAITALSQEQLNSNHVKDVLDLVDLVPALDISRHGDQNALDVTLRGVGSTNRTELGDPTVAFHVNDVYSPRPQGAAVLMYDVERVEVLRGPQGTLFGRNATVGSINIHTARPRLGELSGDVSVTAGNYDRLGFKGALNVPFGENFAMRLAAYTDEHDAYVKVLPSYIGLLPEYTEENSTQFNKSPQVGIRGYEAEDQQSYRLSALWQITDNVQWFVSFEDYQDNGTGAVDLDPVLVNRGIRGVVVDSPGFVDMTNRAFSSNLSWRFGDLTARYVFGAANQKRSQVWDADLGRTNTFQEDRTEFSDYDFRSHELTLANSDEARLRWLVGVYDSREKNAIRFDIDVMNINPDGTPGNGNWPDGNDGGGASFRQPDRQLKSSAVFSQVTYDLTDSLRITAGARYIDDEKSDRGGRSINCDIFIRRPLTEESLAGQVPSNEDLFQDASIQAGAKDGGTRDPTGANPCWVRQVNDTSASWNKTTGLLRLEFDAAEDVMVYGSVATGFKSGIIQDAGLTADPEELTNYEIGMKSDWLGGRLRLNVAAYWMDYEDMQFSSPQLLDTDGDNIPDSQGSLLTRNAAASTIKGIETELSYLVGDRGLLQITANWLDAKFDEFLSVDGQYGPDNPWNPRASGPLGDEGFVDLSGNRLIRAPEYEITIAYQHEIVTPFGSLTPRAKVSFVDDTFLDEFNRTDFVNPTTGQVQRNISVQPSYEWVDLSLLYTPPQAAWSLDLFVRNATDEDVRTGLQSFPTAEGISSYYRPPRTYGVTWHYSFE